MIMGIEHIAICSADTVRLKDWYIKMFAFQAVYDNGKGNFFLKTIEGDMIEFIKTDDVIGVPGEKACGLRHLALTVDNFEEMVQELLAKKVEVVTAANVSPEGNKTFFFRDPDGNLLHLIYRPKPLN